MKKNLQVAIFGPFLNEVKEQAIGTSWERHSKKREQTPQRPFLGVVEDG